MTSVFSPGKPARIDQCAIASLLERETRDAGRQAAASCSNGQPLGDCKDNADHNADQRDEIPDAKGHLQSHSMKS